MVNSTIIKNRSERNKMSYLSGIPNTILALVGIGLTLFIAKDKLKLEEKIDDIRGRINL